MKKSFFVLVAFVFLLGGAGSVLADPFQNGSFEIGPTDIPPDVGFMTLDAVNTSILGWTVESGSIDLIGTYWIASDGERSIDLNGYESAGAISQTFDTEVGEWYLVQFDMAGNPDDGPIVKVLVASIGDPESAAFQYEFDTTNKSTTDMGWETKSFTFLAESATTKIMFKSSTEGSWGPAIDNVRVVKIGPFPEDTLHPAGAVHAYNNVIWPPNNKRVPVKLKGYVMDELSIARDGGGTGVSTAYLLVGGKKIILKDSGTDLLDEYGRFRVTTYLKAKKGAKYAVKLYAADTAGNEGLVDLTYITVPHDMSGHHKYNMCGDDKDDKCGDDKQEKEKKEKKENKGSEKKNKK